MNTPRTARRLPASRIAITASILALLVGCASAARPVSATRTMAPQGPAQPERTDQQEPIASINRDLSSGETLWHLRSALNVAALSCRQKQENQIAIHYNRILRQHRTILAEAYSQEQEPFRSRYGSNWQARQDRHMTSLYNFFANPVATRQFCAAALSVSARVNQLSSDQLKFYAGPALAKLERPLISARSLSQR